MDILLYISLISGVVNCLPLNNHPLFKEEEYDVTLLKNPITRKYYVNPAEFGKYEQQFSKIKSLGEEIECKLSGMCAGKKRGDISSKTEKLQNNPGKKKSFDSMLEEESKGAELQLNAPYRRKNLYEKSNDIQSQFISVENMNTPPYGGARNPPASLGGEKKTRFGGKMHYTQQPDAEMYGQQPQMDIEMPMDPQFLKQDRPGVNAGHENMPGGGTSSMMGGQMGGGMGPMGFPDQEQGPPGDMPDEEAAPSVEEQSKMQSDQLENSIQQSLAHKMRFLESANGPPSPSVGRNEQQISQLSRFSQDSPYGNEMEGKDTIEKGKESPLENEEESKARETEQNYSPFNRKDAPADMNSFLDASTRDTPSPDFVEENAQMALQSNSDYQVPGSAFSSLWKSFLLTTQSQLGESDPSANSREGINKPQGQKSPPSKKKANKNHVEKRTVIAKKQQSFMYIPLYVVKSLLAQAVHPEKEKHVSGEARHLNSHPPIYVTYKHGKRFLVVNPDSEFLSKVGDLTHYENFLDTQIKKQKAFLLNLLKQKSRNGPFGGQTIPFQGVVQRPLEGKQTVASHTVSQNTIFDRPFASGQFDLEPTNLHTSYLVRHQDNGDVNGHSVTNDPDFPSPQPNPMPPGLSQMIAPPVATLPTGFARTRTGELLRTEDFNVPGARRSFDFDGDRVNNIDKIFENISARQVTVPERNYRDPEYDPHESETMFNSELHHRDPFTDNSPRSKAEKEEIVNALLFSRQNKLQRLAQNRAKEEVVANLREYATNRRQTQQREEEGFNKESDANERRSYQAQPFVYTKEHVGFGPITVEAKTANAPASTDDDS